MVCDRDVSLSMLDVATLVDQVANRLEREESEVRIGDTPILSGHVKLEDGGY